MRKKITQTWETCTPQGDIFRIARYGVDTIRPIAYLGNVVGNEALQKQQRENPCEGKRGY